MKTPPRGAAVEVNMKIANGGGTIRMGTETVAIKIQAFYSTCSPIKDGKMNLEMMDNIIDWKHLIMCISFNDNWN